MIKLKILKIMRNIKYIFGIAVVLLFVTACDNENPLEDLGGETGAFASWVSPPSGDLLTSDPSSAISWEFELIDGNNGNDVESVSVNVTDGTNSGTVATISSFSANDNGNQGASGSFDLNDIASALGVGISDIGEGDSFDFTIEVTKTDGSVWGQANSSIASGHSPANPFSRSTAIETVSLVSSSVDSTWVNANSVDTLFLEFANDFTSQLEVNPTITAISSEEAGLGTVGPINVIQDVNGVDSVYWVSYEPSGAAADTISFEITGASAFSSGYVMENDTVQMAYIVDNVNPSEETFGLVPVFDEEGNIVGIQFIGAFSETLGSVEIVADYDDSDDNDGDVGATPTGKTINFTLDWTEADGPVTFDIQVKDLAGNTLDLGSFGPIDENSF